MRALCPKCAATEATGAVRSSLARQLAIIMPAITLAGAFETNGIQSVAGLIIGRAALVPMRPCRTPTHTIADVVLIGGRQVSQPGEVSPAHHGILSLDEGTKFKRHVLELLR
jgi:magnesium chelatase family protein